MKGYSSLVLDEGNAVDVQQMTLEQCVETAFANNRRRPASRYAVEVAEAQHRQALAAYWPRLSSLAGYQRMDANPNFVVPGFSLGSSVGIPGVGVIPYQINIPEQDIKVMDRESYRATLKADWLLYDGGQRLGLREQTRGNLEMMQQVARRTDLEVMDTVRRYYHGAVLATQLHELGKDKLATMEAMLELTETLYKEGGGTVKKTDWLDNKIMVDMLRGIVADLMKNELLALAALSNVMGMPRQAHIRPADTQLSFTPFAVELEDMIGAAYTFNPDWLQIEAGLRAAEGGVRSATSGYSPTVFFGGELHRWWNDHEKGMATKDNKRGWNVGIGVQIPIFDGFLTRNRVAEAQARVSRIGEERLLLREGIALQIREIILALGAAEKSYETSLSAMNAAVESRELNTRAYQLGLIDTEKLVRAQLVEGIMTAQYFRSIFDHISLRSRLELTVGKELMKIMDER